MFQASTFFFYYFIIFDMGDQLGAVPGNPLAPIYSMLLLLLLSHLSLVRLCATP